MPFNIANRYTVSFHRGTLLAERGVKPNAKDTQYPALGPDQPTQKASRIPRVSIDPLTPYTALPTDDAVWWARAVVPRFHDHDDIVTAVDAHLTVAFAMPPPAGQGRLVFVGDHHEAKGSVTSVLAVLAHLGRNGPPGTVLFEVPQDNLTTVLKNARALMRTQQSGQGVPTALRRAIARAPYGEQTLMVKAHLALMAGFSIGTFDSDRTQTRVEPREAVMVTNLRGHLRRSRGPIVVVTGVAHLGPLKEGVAGLAQTAELMNVNPTNGEARPLPLHPHIRKRLSYGLSRPEVLCFRSSDPLENQVLDYRALAVRNGLGANDPRNARPSALVLGQSLQ
jgi:hypothetical protein